MRLPLLRPVFKLFPFKVPEKGLEHYMFNTPIGWISSLRFAPFLIQLNRASSPRVMCPTHHFSGTAFTSLNLCLYCTKLEPISKTNDSEKAPRTGEYASNPERKNTPCISDLVGVKFLLKKERVFFFRGSAQEVFGQCVGLQYGLGKTKIYFSGEKSFFALARLLYRPQKGVWGMNAGGIRNCPNFFADGFHISKTGATQTKMNLPRAYAREFTRVVK